MLLFNDFQATNRLKGTTRQRGLAKEQEEFLSLELIPAVVWNPTYLKEGVNKWKEQQKEILEY